MKARKIIIAVSGSIAAYKAAQLVREFITSGAEVRVLMTESAKAFISPLTLSTLSRNPVYSDVIDDESWNNHVELGLWADVMVVAPATANTLARMSNGICDSIISAVYLSARCPVVVAPAMDLDMWKHPATRQNIARLKSYGTLVMEPGTGELASGLHGKGRMPEPAEILQFVQGVLDKKKDLANLKVLITAGPTYEYIDPVRFIGNRSTGRMGVALARECASRGAQVCLILGPTTLEVSDPGIEIRRVCSAEEMYQEALAQHASCQLAIFTAAVADYTPGVRADQKIKKTGDKMTLQLERTPDIADLLGQKKSAGQHHIGFALETENEAANAEKKLGKKNFDMVVMNSLNDPGAGFAHETNKVTIFTDQHPPRHLPLKSKTELAGDIVNSFIEFFVKA